MNETYLLKTTHLLRVLDELEDMPLTSKAGTDFVDGWRAAIGEIRDAIAAMGRPPNKAQVKKETERGPLSRSEMFWRGPPRRA